MSLNTSSNMSLNSIKQYKKRFRSHSETSNIIKQKDFKSYFNLSDLSEDDVKLKSSPSCIEANYKTDLNLVEIHKNIRCKFAHDKFGVNELKIKLNEIKLQIKTSTSEVEEKALQKEAKLIDDEILMIESDTKWKLYLEKASDILKRYYDVMSNAVKGIISLNHSEEDVKIINIRLDTISEYINLLKEINILKIDIRRIFPAEYKCPICGKDMSDIEENFEGNIICECGYKSTSISNNLDFCDETERSPQRIDTHKDLPTFLDTLDRIECKCNKPLDPNIFISLDKWCIENDFPTGKEVVERKIMPPLRKLDTIMKETGLTIHYKWIYQIRHVYWGWEPPRLDIYRSQIIQNFITTQNIYHRIKGTGRVSKINNDLLAYLHMKAVGYPNCNIEDFKIPTIENSIIFADQSWKTMCEEANIKYTPLR